MIDINLIILFLNFLLFYLYIFIKKKKNDINKIIYSQNVKEDTKVTRNNKIIEGPYIDRNESKITRNNIISEKGGSKPYNNIILDNKNLDNDMPNYEKPYNSYRKKFTQLTR